MGGQPGKADKASKAGIVPVSYVRTRRQMKIKTRRQRYDNEDPSAGHDSTPPPSKMMSPSSDHEDRREKKNHNECPGTNYQQPNPLMTTQLSTSAGLGHFLAIELPNNKDQNPPKDEKMNCVDTIE